MILSSIAKGILRVFGWNTTGVLPEGLTKAVLIVAPHTSYWDFVIGRLTFGASKVKVRVLIKEEAFVFPFSGLLKLLGGVPVARGKKNNMVDKAVEYLSTHDDLVVVITPEGSRRLVRQWKKGFYMIAEKAKVPIALGYIDYKTKTGGVGPIIYPSGNYEADLVSIQNFYRGMTACHPEKFNLSPNSNFSSPKKKEYETNQ
jgi:1-acyl-sn-glycerol-3-phosphate acyltransferase